MKCKEEDCRSQIEGPVGKNLLRADGLTMTLWSAGIGGFERAGGDRRPAEAEYCVPVVDLDTYNDVFVNDNDDNFRMRCVTAETNTVTTAIVRNTVLKLSATNFRYNCHQGGAVARLPLTSVACLWKRYRTTRFVKLERQSGKECRILKEPNWWYTDDWVTEFITSKKQQLRLQDGFVMRA
jgi:hypothetical protein